MVFYEEESQLITAGIDGCFIFDFEIHCKYDYRLAILLDPKGRSLSFNLKMAVQLEYVSEWAKGLHVDHARGILSAWSSETLCFYKLSKEPGEMQEAQGKVIYKYF